MEWKKDTGPLNPLRVTSTGIEGHATMVIHLFPYKTMTEEVISDQSTDPRTLKHRVHFAHLGFQWSYVQAALETWS